jgi:Tol biopolymer transport system component
VLVVAVVVSFGFGVASGTATRAQTGSVCAVAGGVATWSPDGKRIAFVGGAGSRHAICVAYADGTHARPLRYTVCRRRCQLPLISFFGQLDWVRPRLLLYLDNFRIFKLLIGQRPQLLGKVQGGIDTFAVDTRGDRVALGSSVCSNCRGPVTVLSVPTGRIIGQIGGPAADNYYPSLSPDGKRLVFTETEPQIGVWTASADGSDVQPLKPCGGTPIWSPRGDKILCSGLPAQPPRRCCSFSLVSPEGSPATALVPRGVKPNVLGWSPNGQRVVFLTGRCSCQLAVVNARTRNTRWLGGDGSPVSADWSPDSRQLLVTDPSTAYPNCALLWRVPANGTKPQRIRNCA